MNWRSLRFLVVLVFLFMVLSIVLFIFLHFISGTNPFNNPNASTTKAAAPPLPTPSSARTTYSNATFNYTVDYPTQWYLTKSSDTSLVRIFMRHDPSIPEAVAFEITCFANPGQLDNQTFWQQTQPPNGSEIGIGPMTFSSGTSAYVAKGQGQSPYIVYTLVNKQVACQIVTLQTDPGNAQVVLSAVNSFRW